METDQENVQPNSALLFRFAISNNFKRIAESVSKETFLDTLTILKSKPHIAKKLHEAMFEELYENMNDDLNDIMKEGSLQEGLEKIAKLSDANSSAIEDAWRPPGDVSLHLRSLDAEVIKQESDLLEEQVNAIAEENAILMKTIADKRSALSALNSSITRCLSRHQSIIDTLEDRLENLEKSFMILDHD